MRIIFIEKGMNAKPQNMYSFRTNYYINFRWGIVVRPFKIEKYDLKLHRQQSGAVVACWAHNPEVRGSKPRSAKKILILLYIFKKKNDNECNVDKKKLRIKNNIQIIDNNLINEWNWTKKKSNRSKYERPNSTFHFK